MSLSREKIGLIHVAKARLSMDDGAYRSLLGRVAGVDSSRDLTGETFDLVMQEFRRLGFESDASKRNFGERRGMASDAQVHLIRELWGQYTNGEGTDASLGHWLERTFKVSALKFLDDRRASRAIDALKAMKARRSAASSAP